MKTILLSSTILMALALPAFADQNSIKIDIGGSTTGKVTSLAIGQDDTAASNQVSGNGVSGASGTNFTVDGNWNAITVNQTGGKNVLKGGIKSSNAGATTASLNANYAATGVAGNTHSLSIGGTTAPSNPTVKIYVSNNGATANTVTDTLDGTALTYSLGLAGTGNAVTNAVGATGAVTLTEGDGTANYGVHGGYGISGDGNTVVNTIASGGAVNANLRIAGNNNNVTNAITASGDVTLNQGNLAGITGNANTVDNQVVAVGSLLATQTIAGDNNAVSNALSGTGAKAITQSLASNGNLVSVTMSADGDQTSNFAADAGSFVDYAHLSAASGRSADVSLSGVIGTTASATDKAVVRVQQTDQAGGATVVLTVTAGTGITMGTLTGTLPGTYGGSVTPAPGVLVYQNSSGAYLSANVTAAASGYTAKFVQ